MAKLGKAKCKGGFRMEFNVNKEGKYAMVWLRNDEKDDPEVQKSLQPLVEECKKKKFRLVIMESGNRDLKEQTTSLLLHNRGLERSEDEKTTYLPKSAAMAR